MKQIREYFSLLFSDWLNIISNVVTIVSLVVGLLDSSILPSYLSSIPKEGYILLAFVAFSLANFRIYQRNHKEDSKFDFEILKIDGIGLANELFQIKREEASLTKSIPLMLTVRLVVTHKGPPSSVRFSLESVKFDTKDLPFSLTELKLIKSGTGTKLENPHYFKPDEMSDSYQIRVDFEVDTEEIERLFGAIGNIGSLDVTFRATSVNEKAINRTIECDYSPIHTRTEERFIAKLQHTPNSATSMVMLMKRYWKGPK
jgi:hypothetical protein